MKRSVELSERKMTSPLGTIQSRPGPIPYLGTNAKLINRDKDRDKDKEIGAKRDRGREGGRQGGREGGREGAWARSVIHVSVQNGRAPSGVIVRNRLVIDLLR